MAHKAMLFILVLLSGIQLASSLEFATGSPCAALCLDIGNSTSTATNATDIVCDDLSYTTTNTGIKYKNCLECLQNSEEVHGDDSDAKWFIYNLRYSISTCLFSYPKTALKPIEDSPCVINYACEPLKEPLIDDKLDPNAGNAWSYCSADDGLFMGKTLDWCISCLQATEDQVYLSNFLIALEAGCQQTPTNGSTVSLSGSVFTTGAVNITEPPVDITSKPAGAGSSTMTTGTIVGIAVGVGLVAFAVAAMLFFYCRRRKAMRSQEKAYALDSKSSTPDPSLPEGTSMSQPLRDFTQGGRRSGDDAPPYMSSGEYYDKMNQNIRQGDVNYAFDPRSQSRALNSALPAHKAYNPGTRSRAEYSQTAGKQNPTPPQHAHTRSNVSDSYAMQTYLSSVDDGPAAGNTMPPLPVHQQSRADHRRASSVPLPPPPPRAPKAPALRLPSLSKVRIPKKYNPPQVHVQEATPVDERGHKMSISDPVMNADTSRFQDKPLGGPVVYSTVGPESQASIRRKDYKEVPIHSGKSTLYGI